MTLILGIVIGLIIITIIILLRVLKWLKELVQVTKNLNIRLDTTHRLIQNNTKSVVSAIRMVNKRKI